MQDRFPFTGFPLRKVNVLEYSPGIALALEGGSSQRSGLKQNIQSVYNTLDWVDNRSSLI